jgi:D-alanyl-D-alanine carboxypeptidase
VRSKYLFSNYCKWFYSFAIVLLILSMTIPVSANVTASGQSWPNSVDDAIANGRWPTIEEIPAKAWIVVDASDGTILLAHNEYDKNYPASTTKIMTALTVLSDSSYDPDRILTASETAVDLSWDSSKIYLQKDETIRMHDAMAGLMLASGNDAANVLAEAVSGSIEEFARRMTVEAFALGAENTSFMNPHGLHDENHYTTAADLAVIARAAMQLPDFRELVSAETYSLPASNKHWFNGWNTILNTNRLMHFDQSYLYSPYIQEIIGIKTGTTSAAGFCLVSAGKTHDNRELISVLLGIPYEEKQGSTWIYSRTLLEEAAKKIGAPAVKLEDYLAEQAGNVGDNNNAGDNIGESITEQTTEVVETSEELSDQTNVSETSVKDNNTNNQSVSDDGENDLQSTVKFWIWIALALSLISFSLLVVTIRQRKIIRKSRIKRTRHIR